jgi:hypothetical protein
MFFQILWKLFFLKFICKLKLSFILCFDLVFCKMKKLTNENVEWFWCFVFYFKRLSLVIDHIYTIQKNMIIFFAIFQFPTNKKIWFWNFDKDYNYCSHVSKKIIFINFNFSHAHKLKIQNNDIVILFYIMKMMVL